MRDRDRGGRRRLRSARVAAPLTAAVAALLLAGCDEPAPVYDYAAVCVDPATQQRVADDRCDDDYDDVSGDGTLWFFYSTTGGDRRAPAVGQRVAPAKGSFRRPTHGAIARGVPAAGGPILRGGFGTHSGAGS
ncbi:hypothetical protein GCM10012275_38510 [Longimycelium tulufanense]|uniref:Uncharacterized protein n=1 Tax=Longimycelium tulufanense TaxID=907463 RepID=A0A8J3FX03_9PSEU|nr:hypothetical protein [Longimycelium tulufanense]GGM64257.1 hypothetical protein GCM10012275_38510 [Longimycelium tulufanense]